MSSVPNTKLNTVPSVPNTCEDWQAKMELLDRLLYIYENNNFADVVFLTGEIEEKVLAHKLMLCIASPVFDRNFNGEINHHTNREYIKIDDKDLEAIRVPDIQPEVIKCLLRYLYTEELCISFDRLDLIFNLIYTAKKYFIYGLEDKTAAYLIQYINPENVHDILSISSSAAYENITLINACQEFLIKNAIKIIRSKIFKNISPEQLKSFSSLNPEFNDQQKLLLFKKVLIDKLLKKEYCLAKKYNIDGLEKKVVDYLILTIKCENAHDVLMLALEYQNQILIESSERFLIKNMWKMISAKSFKNIHQKQLERFLKLDLNYTSGIKEWEIFEKVLLWAEAECTRKCLEQTLENKRNVLGNILNEIRFAHMDYGKLLKYIKDKENCILTEKECHDLILIYNMGEFDVKECTLNLNPRLKYLNKTTVYASTDLAYASTDLAYASTDLALSLDASNNKISFKIRNIRRRVWLTGLSLCGSNSEFDITIKIMNDNQPIAEIAGIKTSSYSTNSYSFNSPIEIDNNELYELIMQVNQNVMPLNQNVTPRNQNWIMKCGQINNPLVLAINKIQNIREEAVFEFSFINGSTITSKTMPIGSLTFGY